MAGLIDITPAVETIDVRGHSVEVSGLSVEAIGNLFLRFPRFRQMVETNKWDTQSILKMSDEAIHAVIAASCNGAFNEKTASYLTLSEKAELIGAIFKITMPKGVGPFVELMQAFGLLASGASNTALATTSPLPSKNSSEQAAIRRQKSTHQESLPAG